MTRPQAPAKVTKLNRVERNAWTKQKVFDAATKVVGKYGYAEASVARITEEAGRPVAARVRRQPAIFQPRRKEHPTHPYNSDEVVTGYRNRRGRDRRAGHPPAASGRRSQDRPGTPE